MLSFAKIAIATWLIVSAVACAKTTDESGVGTNTNWLRTCDDASDCSDGRSCLCGVCTLSCEESSECSAVNAATRCEVVNASVCGASSAAGSACLQDCQSDDDCTAYQDGKCMSGLCVPEDRGGMMPVDAGPNPRMDGGPLTDPYSLSREGAVVEISTLYTECRTSPDCEVVSTSCDGCCQQGAINTDLRTRYDENMALACGGSLGGGCPCEPRDLTAVCYEGQCKLVATEDAYCYAPGNDENPYDGGAHGCDCDLEGQGICTPNAALVCNTYDGGITWQTVEDGPCEPVADTACENGQRRETPEACVADFFTCRLMPNGEFCGTDPI